MFNINIMPEQKDLDLNEATSRRFIIIPFEKRVEKGKIDIHLAKKICDTELSGIFNLVVEGLMRILQKEAFSESPAIEEFMKEHWNSLNPVIQFIDENHFVRSKEPGPYLQEMYKKYIQYCSDNGLDGQYDFLQTFSKQLRKQGFIVRKVGSQACRVFVKVAENAAPAISNPQDDEHDEHDANFHC
jgi:putative DNA primase/helicase